jgi:hypothetical protein
MALNPHGDGAPEGPAVNASRYRIGPTARRQGAERIWNHAHLRTCGLTCADERTGSGRIFENPARAKIVGTLSDAKFTATFDVVFSATGITAITTALQTPTSTSRTTTLAAATKATE